MPQITVAKAFNLILNPGGDKLRYEPGVHEVSDEIANHWYTQEHLAAGGAPGAKKARDAADAAFLKAKAAVDEYERFEREAHDAELAAGVEISVSAWRRLGGRPEAPEVDDGAEADGQDSDAATETTGADDGAAKPEGEGGEQPPAPPAPAGDPAAPASGSETPPADGQAQDPAPVEPAPADTLDSKTDEELRQLIKARDGRMPHPATSREKLLAAAGGDAAIASEIEADGQDSDGSGPA